MVRQTEVVFMVVFISSTTEENNMVLHDFHMLTKSMYCCADVHLLVLNEGKAKCTLVQAVRLCTGRTAHRWSRGIALLFLDHGIRRGWGVSVTLRPLFTPRERPGTHCTGGCVGPRVGLDRCEKSRPPPGFEPRTVQHVASRYTDYATRPTHKWILLV